MIGKSSRLKMATDIAFKEGKLCLNVSNNISRQQLPPTYPHTYKQPAPTPVYKHTPSFHAFSSEGVNGWRNPLCGLWMRFGDLFLWLNLGWSYREASGTLPSKLCRKLASAVKSLRSVTELPKSRCVREYGPVTFWLRNDKLKQIWGKVNILRLISQKTTHMGHA